MKKINSIGYGDKILTVDAVLLLGIPAIAKGISLIIHNPAIFLFGKVSFASGLFLLLLFSILLAIEFHQDKRLAQYYENKQNERQPLENGLFECQSCGNRQVHPRDKQCRVCGINFKNER